MNKGTISSSPPLEFSRFPCVVRPAAHRRRGFEHLHRHVFGQGNIDQSPFQHEPLVLFAILQKNVAIPQLSGGQNLFFKGFDVLENETIAVAVQECKHPVFNGGRLHPVGFVQGALKSCTARQVLEPAVQFALGLRGAREVAVFYQMRRAVQNDHVSPFQRSDFDQLHGYPPSLISG